MKYNFYEIIGVKEDASRDEIINAFNEKCRELEKSDDIKLWNFLLRSASELGIKYVKSYTPELGEADPKFYGILGITSDASKEEIIEVLKEKYSYLLNQMDVQLWNFLHRESSKLGIYISEYSISKEPLRIYHLLNLPDNSTEEEIENAWLIAWEKAKLLPINDSSAKYAVELYSAYQQYLNQKQYNETDTKVM